MVCGLENDGRITMKLHTCAKNNDKEKKIEDFNKLPQVIRCVIGKVEKYLKLNDDFVIKKGRIVFKT